MFQTDAAADVVYTATLATSAGAVVPGDRQQACDPAVPRAASFDEDGFGASPELRRLQSAVGNLGQRAFLARDASAARCVMAWVEALHGHAGLLCAEDAGPGPFTALHSQGYVRTRAAAAVALASAQAVDLLGGPPSPAAAAMLSDIAACAERYVAGRAARGAVAHNQAFWGMLAEAAAFHVLGDGEEVGRVAAEVAAALDAVDPEGFLPLELRRDAYALSYHNFAMEPLTQLALIARGHGVDLLAGPDAALERLGDRTIAGLADPATFAARTGFPQVTDRLDTPAHDGWIALYRALTAGR